MTSTRTGAADGERGAPGREGGKYLTFRLGDEEYGVEILKVREIIGLMEITQVPQMPAFVKGVINLRGKVIPVLDLRLKFEMEEAAYTEQTCVIVVDVGSLTGIIVDTVHDVIDVPGDRIDPLPPLSAAVDTRFIRGLGRVKDEVTILLDIDEALADGAARAIESVTSNAQDR